MPADPVLEAAGEVACALAGGPIDAIERVRGFGRNSGVYRVRAPGATYALKQYPPRRPEERDRASVEHQVLGFLAGHGIASVPRPIAADPAAGYLLLEWIDGDPVASPDADDIAAAGAFLCEVHALRTMSDAAALPQAAEACLCGAEIVAQIERRLARLGAVARQEPALSVVLDGTMAPLLDRVSIWVAAGHAAANLDFDEALNPSAQTLCPADFGFHNALRRPPGILVFIDFDYFGWDDPVKLTADFLLHPGMNLDDGLKRQFAAAAMRVYGDDPCFRQRLALLYPLFALRWCAILLNEFLPERWANRLNAGAEADWAAAKERQLARVRRWLEALAADFTRFPFCD
jgi:hypothetical protein